jgi:hypothetical protein
MKLILRITLILFIAFSGINNLSAQKDKAKRKSPPVSVSQTIDDLNITINYGQPAVNRRVIYGELVPYDQVWRTGANEATTITFDKDVLINGSDLLGGGTYSLFTIPAANGNWVVIFNKVADQWGAYDYKQESDALRINVKATKNKNIVEKLNFVINKSGTVVFSWEYLTFSFNVSAS